jgi:hypothetical protein
VNGHRGFITMTRLSLPKSRSVRSDSVIVVPSTVRTTLLTLLAARSSGATICPSEVARACVPTLKDAGAAAQQWREAMPLVHATVDELLLEGNVQLSWKGKPLASRAGPYRISRRKLQPE